MTQPSQKAIEYLLANPETADFFDEKFGAGAAQKILAPAQAQSTYAAMRPSQVASTAVANIPSSAAKMAEDIYQTVTSPIKTTKAIWDVAAGGLQNLLPERLVQLIGEDKASRQAASAVAQFYRDRYGSEEGFKKAIATDPVGVMADLSTILTGGATGTSRMAPATSSALRQAAAYVDPLSLAAKTTAGVTDVTKKVVPAVLGTTTGAGPEAISLGFQAGKTGGETGAQFRQNLRGQAEMTDVLDAAKSNLDEMNRIKQAEYKQNMTAIRTDKTVLDLAPIDNALSEAFNKVSFKGQIENKAAADKVAEASEKVAMWKQLDPAEFHTPEGIDSLKKQIGGVLESIPFEQKTARLAVGEIYNSIKGEITKQAPTYAKTMKAYSDATDQIKEIEKALSLGKKASADTALRKLQSIMRNNVNTNYGQRVTLARELEAAGGRQMLPALAGQALSNIAPRGIQGATAPLGAIGLFGTGGLPAAVTGAALSSPRFVGEAAYAAGQAAALPGRVGRGLLDLEQRLPAELQITPRAAGMQMPEIDFRTLNLLYQLRQREEENP